MAKHSHLRAALGAQPPMLPPGQPMLPSENDPAQQQDPSLLLAMLMGQDQSGMPAPQRPQPQ
jgi:hypothetical protein